ncbi:MAG: ATP-binding protein [Candidatus Eremiobacteraeota bacterium]|nr:ATP-binding protein [Candidatus Eremiobacteraeota bacterium]
MKLQASDVLHRSPDTNAGLIIRPPVPAILCDPMGMELVLVNLVTNSLQSQAAAGKKLVITLSALKKKGFVELIFKDDGLGLAPENLERIFDHAFTTWRSGRFGFGLPIVKKIIEAHGGTVRARSEGPGRGAEFILTLPVE